MAKVKKETKKNVSTSLFSLSKAESLIIQNK